MLIYDCFKTNGNKWAASYHDELYLKGWDFPGEPGNQVPRKSLVSSEILARHHAFLCERKWFHVKGNDFMGKKMISWKIMLDQVSVSTMTCTLRILELHYNNLLILFCLKGSEFSYFICECLVHICPSYLANGHGKNVLNSDQLQTSFWLP